MICTDPRPGHRTSLAGTGWQPQDVLVKISFKHDSLYMGGGTYSLPSATEGVSRVQRAGRACLPSSAGWLGESGFLRVDLSHSTFE